MSETVNLAAVDGVVDQSLANIAAAINRRPQVNSSTLAPFVQWSQDTLREVLSALELIVPMVTGRLRDLEARPQIPSPVSTRSGGVTPRAPTSASQSAGRVPRCSKCHARGHSTSECRTTNPAAMRRRVAQNSRIAREARAAQAAHALLPTPGPSIYGPATPAAPNVPMALAALAADATELRRRTAQSNRDKRLHRASTRA